MNRPATDYELFEQASEHNRRLLREEELILDVTEAVSAAMQEAGISKAQLAKRMGRTKGFITQLLSGGRNLTLRTLADIADALEARVTITVSKDRDSRSVSSEPPDLRIIHIESWPSPWSQPSVPKEIPVSIPPQTPVGEYGAAL